MKAAAIRLSPLDNVAVCCRALMAGETIDVDGTALAITEEVALGHKIAMSELQPGSKVIKYGMSIGSVTASVPAGGWVHMHNMKSDYISAHTREATGGEQ